MEDGLSCQTVVDVSVAVDVAGMGVGAIAVASPGGGHLVAGEPLEAGHSAPREGEATEPVPLVEPPVHRWGD